MFAVQAEGADVVTIEGIGPPTARSARCRRRSARRTVAVRLLHARASSSACTRFLRAEPEPDARRDPRRAVRQPLSLHRLPGDHQGRADRSGDDEPSPERRESTRRSSSPRPTARWRSTRRLPTATPAGAVIVIQEAFGVNDHIEDVARRFAAAGLPRRRPGAVPPRGRRHRALRRLQQGHAALRRAHRRRRARGRRRDARAPARGAGFADGSIGIVGFCFGGRVTFLVAAAPEARRRGRASTAAGSRTAGGMPVPPLIEEVGVAADPVARAVRRPGRHDPGRGRRGPARGAASDAPVDTEIVRYPDAGHGFHCDARESYHESRPRTAGAAPSTGSPRTSAEARLAKPLPSLGPAGVAHGPASARLVTGLGPEEAGVMRTDEQARATGWAWRWVGWASWPLSPAGPVGLCRRGRPRRQRRRGGRARVVPRAVSMSPALPARSRCWSR